VTAIGYTQLAGLVVVIDRDRTEVAEPLPSDRQRTGNL
jgi:hypothetical protein